MEALVQLDDERVLRLRSHAGQDGLLGKSMLKLLMSQNVSLRDCFERVERRGLLVAHEKDLTRAALAQHAHHLEVVDGDLA